MSTSQAQHHVLVVGHGRSGTNMVLDLFDCHPNTFCRNEPNELVGSAFRALGDPMFQNPVPDDFLARWQAALAHTVKCNGDRDRFGTDKIYFRSEIRAKIGQKIQSRRRVRNLFLGKRAGQAPEEWLCPRFHYDPAAQARALPVLKILLAPAWISLTHAQDPNQYVVHVLRDPQDFIQSWWGRYVTGIGGGPEQVFADNQPSLARILAHFKRPDEMPQSYSMSNLIVSELWRWRYMNEVVMDQLSGSERYIRVLYDAVMSDQAAWAERLYDFAGLEMTPASQTAIGGLQNTLFRARKSDALDPALVTDAITQVVQGSPYEKQLLSSL